MLFKNRETYSLKSYYIILGDNGEMKYSPGIIDFAPGKNNRLAAPLHPRLYPTTICWAPFHNRFFCIIDKANSVLHCLSCPRSPLQNTFAVPSGSIVLVNHRLHLD